MKNLVKLSFVVLFLLSVSVPAIGQENNNEDHLNEVNLQIEEYSQRALRLIQDYSERKKRLENDEQRQGISKDHLNSLLKEIKKELEKSDFPKVEIDNVIKKIAGYTLLSNKEDLDRQINTTKKMRRKMYS